MVCDPAPWHHKKPLIPAGEVQLLEHVHITDQICNYIPLKLYHIITVQHAYVYTLGNEEV